MKEKWNFRKLLAAVGLLSLVVPSSLTVVACKKNQTSLVSLSEAFKGFKFHDQKNVEEFLDCTNSDTITKQVEEYIKKFLEPTNLVLEKQTSNSVVVKAKSDSKNYYGQVTLSWNLKLFEIWGAEVENASDTDVRKGLKGYFYLDYQDQYVKFFDVAGYKNIKNVVVAEDNEIETHNFYFVNKKNINKEFAIYSHNLTVELPSLFNKFSFTTGLEVKVDAKKTEYIRIFDKNAKQWRFLTKKDYLIDDSGNIT